MTDRSNDSPEDSDDPEEKTFFESDADPSEDSDLPSGTDPTEKSLAPDSTVGEDGDDQAETGNDESNQRLIDELPGQESGDEHSDQESIDTKDISPAVTALPPDDPESPELWRLRLRARLSSWLLAVVVGLLVVAFAGAVLTYGGYVAESTATEQRVIADGELVTDLEYAAEVTADNELYPVGTELSGQDLYYTGVSPVLDGEYTVRPATSEFESGTLRTEYEVGIRAVTTDGDQSETIWAEQLDSDRVETSTPDEERSVTFSVNISEALNRTEAIESSLGASLGTVELYVLAETRFEGDIDGQAETMQTDAELVIDPGESTYLVERASSSNDQTSATEEVSTETTPGLVFRGGGPLFLLVGLGGLVGAGVARSRSAIALGPDERAWLDYQNDAEQFEEWITVAEPPASIRDRELGTAGSLGDLVDIAIDTDNVVIYDRKRDRYCVFDQNGGYEYVPPEPPAESR